MPGLRPVSGKGVDTCHVSFPFEAALSARYLCVEYIDGCGRIQGWAEMFCAQRQSLAIEEKMRRGSHDSPKPLNIQNVLSETGSTLVNFGIAAVVHFSNPSSG